MIPRHSRASAASFAGATVFASLLLVCGVGFLAAQRAAAQRPVDRAPRQVPPVRQAPRTPGRPAPAAPGRAAPQAPARSGAAVRQQNTVADAGPELPSGARG